MYICGNSISLHAVMDNSHVQMNLACAALTIIIVRVVVQIKGVHERSTLATCSSNREAGAL